MKARIDHLKLTSGVAYCGQRLTWQQAEGGQPCRKCARYAAAFASVDDIARAMCETPWYGKVRAWTEVRQSVRDRWRASVRAGLRPKLPSEAVGHCRCGDVLPGSNRVYCDRCRDDARAATLQRHRAKAAGR